MKSYEIIVRVIVAASICCWHAGVTSSSEAPSADASSVASALDRSGDVGGGNEVLRRRTVNTYRHVNDGASSGAAADGWIIGGSRRRASATSGGSPSKHYYQDKTAGGDRLDKLQWPTVVAESSDAASSLSEVQIVALPSPLLPPQPQQQPNRDDHHNILQPQMPSEISPDASSPPSQWYSKRLSYATKSPSAMSPSVQPVAAESNAVLLAEVLGQKSGFINATAGKGYYGPPITGSKGFQNDLMDMLGKSMWPARFRGMFYYTLYYIIVYGLT